jgi:2-oxo-3-hexenedioate decarboxylase
MTTEQMTGISEKLHKARIHAQAIPQFGKTLENFNEDDAYNIQEEGILYRLDAGETLVGVKMGLTSEAKRQQMNLKSPLYGVLTDKMQVQNGASYSMTASIHPKIEPEVAFLIGKDLKGDVSYNEVLEACDAACAALEILDSRYEQFKYFSMEEVISDNSSSSHFVLGEWKKDFKDLGIDSLKMTMTINGEVVQEGTTKAISGDPVVSVVELVSLLARRGQYLKANTIVLAGAATPAVNLEAGMQVDLKVEGLDSVMITIEA